MKINGKARSSLVSVGVMLCLALASENGHAASPKGQDAAAQQVLRKAQGMLRQLSQEKAALETEKAALQEQVKQLEGVVRELEPLKDEVGRHKSAAEALRNANGALESRINKFREQEMSLLQKQKEIIGKAKLIQADNELLVKAVAEREDWIRQCGDRNRGLIEANGALLDKYRDKGFWEQLGEAEPFTGIAKVQSENAVQDFRYKIEALQVTPFNKESMPEKSAVSEPAPADPEDDDE